VDRGIIQHTSKIKRIEFKAKVISKIVEIFNRYPTSANHAQIVDAWEILRRLIYDKSLMVRLSAIKTLGIVFPKIPERDNARAILEVLTQDSNDLIRLEAVDALRNTEIDITDQCGMGKANYNRLKDFRLNVSWEEIHKLTEDPNFDLKLKAIYYISKEFPFLHNKRAAWEDLHRLSRDDESEVRRAVAECIHVSIQHLPEKEIVWEDLLRLVKDDDRDVRRTAAEVLGTVFSYVPPPHLDSATTNILQLCQDKDENIRQGIVYALGNVLPKLTDNSKPWNILHKLSRDNDKHVREGATEVLGLTFLYNPNKKAAWDDIHHLTLDPEPIVRKKAGDAIGFAYQNIPEKYSALIDLNRLSKDKTIEVRQGVAYALANIFPHISTSSIIWKLLDDLKRDKSESVRASAWYAEGRAHIDITVSRRNRLSFKKELEAALDCFERSTREAAIFHPSRFCLPFYRSYYYILFQPGDNTADLQKCFKDAKLAITGSEVQEQLLEAVQNLATALEEANAINDTRTQHEILQASRNYIQQAEDILIRTADKAPKATKLIKRGLPIIDKEISSKIQEVQKKTESFSDSTKNTLFESVGKETNIEAKKLSINNPITLEINLNNVLNKLKVLCGYLPIEGHNSYCNKIEDAKSDTIAVKFDTIIKTFDEFENAGRYPSLKPIFIEPETNKIVRVAAVQLSYSLTSKFPPTIIEKNEVKQKIFEILEIANSQNVQLICFPELCLMEDWLHYFQNYCKNMIIIAGSYYASTYNICQLIDYKTDYPPQKKITPSSFERSGIGGLRMTPGEKIINLYQTKYGNLAVLICRDFGNFHYFLKGIADIICIPSYNRATRRFHELANYHVRDSPSYIILSNTARFGGTAIFGQIHKDYLDYLIESGFREKRDESYAVCSLKRGEEGIIITDINLLHKSPQLQTPMHPEEENLPISNVFKKLL